MLSMLRCECLTHKRMRSSGIKQDNCGMLVDKKHTSRNHFTFRDFINGGIVHSVGTSINPSYRSLLRIRAIPSLVTNLSAIEAGTVIRRSFGAPLTCGTSGKSNYEGLANSRLHI